jgi:hypothetical protein
MNYSFWSGAREREPLWPEREMETTLTYTQKGCKIITHHCDVRARQIIASLCNAPAKVLQRFSIRCSITSATLLGFAAANTHAFIHTTIYSHVPPTKPYKTMMMNPPPFLLAPLLRVPGWLEQQNKTSTCDIAALQRRTHPLKPLYDMYATLAFYLGHSWRHFSGSI